ncbi:hypothetical protein BUALT_Bualt07G0148400 [Buddleja alternifolia]|uniref:Transposase-associated domain-containing protein n=1 Tax=Buddleja alternifolia TaxID=168488 RepID=A0AAV6XLJ4_9LAMI|nr:hypothetical protein BUALT_Bualt07G0148400 [Buddleja alternifolia]
MDKSWINEPDTFSEAYIKGVESFLQFAKENGMGSDNLIYCPCRSCNNSRFKTLEGVKLDLHMNGFTHNYLDWILHGERVHIFSDSENDISDPIDSNTMNTKSTYLNDDLDEMLDEIGEMRQSNTNFHGVSESFSNLLRNAKRELYPGSLQSDLEQEAGGQKRIRLMQSDPQCGTGKNVRSSRTSPSRAPSTTELRSMGATQDHDTSSPFNSASAGHTDDGIETSIDQNATGSIGSRKCRGVARGCKLDREVKKHGKYKIVFAPGENYSLEHESTFADGLGIVIKHNAQIQGVNRWKQVPVENKEVCLAILLQWFDIEGWPTDERVNKVVNFRLQTVYTRWRNTLHTAYKKLVNEGISPRKVCPRGDLSMAKWQAACDFIEDEKFQVKKSKVVLWRDTHISKKNGGQFVNSVAQSLHEKMIAKQSQPANEDEEPPSEDAILESTLGRRSGYIKGMGHGVEVVRGRQSSSYMVANTELKEKLEEQKKTLEEQRITLDEQKKEMEACKEKHSQEIDALKAQMANMKKLLQTIIG